MQYIRNFLMKNVLFLVTCSHSLPLRFQLLLSLWNHWREEVPIFLVSLLILSWHVSLHIDFCFSFFFGIWREKWNLTDKLMENIYAFNTSYLKAMFNLVASCLCCEITKPSSRVNLNLLLLFFQTIIKKLICFSIIHSMIHKVWYIAIQGLPKSSDAASQ